MVTKTITATATSLSIDESKEKSRSEVTIKGESQQGSPSPTRDESKFLKSEKRTCPVFNFGRQPQGPRLSLVEKQGIRVTKIDERNEAAKLWIALPSGLIPG